MGFALYRGALFDTSYRDVSHVLHGVSQHLVLALVMIFTKLAVLVERVHYLELGGLIVLLH